MRPIPIAIWRAFDLDRQKWPHLIGGYRHESPIPNTCKELTSHVLTYSTHHRRRITHPKNDLLEEPEVFCSIRDW